MVMASSSQVERYKLCSPAANPMAHDASQISHCTYLVTSKEIHAHDKMYVLTGKTRMSLVA
jgi:hypothetical protein